MTLPRRINNHLIAIGLSLASLVIVVIFIIAPAFNSIYSINKEIRSQREELEKKLSMGLNAKKIREELNRVEDSIGQLESVFIKSGSELELITQLETMAQKNRVEAIIKPEFKAQGSGASNRMSLAIAITGKYPDIANFLNELDSQDYYFNTESIAISRTSKNKSESLVTANLSGQIYLKQ